MNLSALLTSVGINLGLCFLYFTLYSILRKQTSYVTFYAPRVVGNRGSEGRVDFSWRRLLPSTVWLMKEAWETSEEEFLSASGLDAVVFMRIFVLSLKVFIFGGIIGIVFLLPVNFMGNQLNYDFFYLRNKSLDLFSISNVDDGSNRLWVHFCAAYVFTGIVCYLLYHEYSYISSKRVSFFDSSERQPHQRSIVYWPFFSASIMKRGIYNLVVVIACVALTILFFVPVVIVQGLTHLDQLEYWFPFLKGILRLTFISRVITGYLPSLILLLFLYVVPRIMILLSSIQGYISLSQIQKSACNKVWWFTVWNAFLAIVLSGTALYPVNVFLEPKDIPKVLAHGVPGQASFFIAYVVTSGWTSLLSELLRLIPLICSFCRWPCSEIDEDFEVPSIPYHEEIPRVLYFGLLGITYFFLAPLILPFILVYYCLGYIIYRHQLLKVYAPKFETGGRFWPIVHNSMIFSLILMHIIAIGIFGLKKLPLASSLTIPLPVLTFLFNQYCRKRFLPIFQEYPTECIVKKDNADQNDHQMLADQTAYQDPVQYSQSKDGSDSPLLAAAEI